MLTRMQARLESPVSRRLRHNAISLRVWRWGLRLTSRSLCQHQSRLAKDGTGVFVLLLSGLASVASVVVLLQLLDGSRLLCDGVDEERHREVVQAIAP